MKKGSYKVSKEKSVRITLKEIMYMISIVLYSLLLYASVHSFDAGWTDAFLRSEDATHYSLTECALLEIAADYLKVVYNITTLQSVLNIEYGQCRIKPIYNAINIELDRLKLDKKRLSLMIDTVAEENTKMDLLEATREATHFHDEQFDEGALLISQRLDAALTSVGVKNYEQARESIGALLHTIQDFYSHSNWIEIGHRVPNKGIGKYQILGKYASKEMRTCVDCDGDSCRTNILSSIIKNNVLTSGYFGLEIPGVNLDRKVKPTGKCSHGNTYDYTVQTDAKGGGINKDTLRSDHGHLHQIAASVAYSATKQILTEFWNTIGNEPFGQFLGLSNSLRNLSSSSLIIVMDDTGSMSPYIEMAKQIAIGIVEMHQTLEYKPSNYILSPFNDPTWGPLTISETPEDFTAEISNLIAFGGGDGPELYYHGIVEALKVCEIGSFLYAFTDAPAKDAYLKSQAIQLAKEKRATITLFYAGGRFRQQQLGRALKSTEDVIEDLYNSNGTDLSTITGGVTMGINPQAVNATKDYIIQRLEADKLVTIIFARGTNMNTSFYVDSSIQSLQIEVTAQGLLTAANFRLIKPSGQQLLLTPTSQTPFILIYTVPIQSGDIGKWTMVSQMNTEHVIQLNGKSQVSCSSTLQKEIIGPSSNISFTPLITQPVRQEANVFVLTICENLPSDLQAGYVDLIDAQDGSKFLQRLSPIRISSTGFLSKITIPDVAFRLSTIATLQNSITIQRQDKEIVSPTFISLNVNNQPYFVIINDILVMNYTVYNHGQTQLAITLRTTDSLGLLSTSGVIKNYIVAAMSNVSDTIQVNATNIDGVNSNSTVITDSVLFSITTTNYEYDEAVPLYILQKNIPLTNQSEYQQPPETSAVIGKYEKSTLFLISSIIILFLLN